MAGKSLGGKLLSFLNSLFKIISSPISGFDVSDVQVKNDGDNFSSLYQFTANDLSDTRGNGGKLTDAKGNKIELNILLTTLNAQTILEPLYTGINDMGIDDADFMSKYDGKSIDNFRTLITKLSDIDLAKSSELNTSCGTFKDIVWTWSYIANNMTYALECATPGKDYGAIEGKNLEQCGKLIAEYLKKVGVTQTDNEVQIDSTNLVIPILSDIQANLQEYYDDAVKKFNLGDFDMINDDTSTETTEPQTLAVFDQQGNFVGYVDISTPEGAAQAQDYESQGYTVGASKHIDVTLQKITGTSDIKMTAIKANYAYSDVLDDIDEIINQEEFIQALPEEPTTYAISVDDAGFDIEPCEENLVFNPCESLCEVFKAGIRAYRNLYIIHWMSFGNDMMKLHLLAEDMYEELIKEIDTIGELLVEKQGTVPQLDFPCDYVPVQNYDFQSSLPMIKSLIDMYIDCIDYAYCNQDPDVQSTLDEWLRYWKKQTRYFIERQEV